MDLDRKSILKLNISAVFVAFAFLLYATNFMSGSFMSTDPWGRFQTVVLAEQVVSSGHVSLAPLSNAYFYNTVNYVGDMQTGPILVGIISMVLDTSLVQSHMLPLMGIPLVFAQAIAARRLYPRAAVFLLAVLFAVNFKFLMLTQTSLMHRGAVGWTMFFYLVAWVFTTSDVRKSKRIVGLIVILPAMVFGEHTFMIASLVFFVTLYLSDLIGDVGTFSTREFALVSVSIVGFYSLISDWFGIAMIKLSGLLQFTLNGNLSFLSKRPESAFPDFLRPYLLDIQLSPEYVWSWRLSAILAVVLLGLTVLNRLKRFASASFALAKVEQLDTFLVALCALLVASAAANIVVGGTSATQPTVIGLYFLPLFGAYPLVKGLRYGYRHKRTVATATFTLLVVLVFVPPAVVSGLSAQPMNDQIKSVEETSFSSSEWLATHTSHMSVTSDLNGIANYIAMGGRGQINYPPTGIPPFRTNNTARGLIRTFYTNPESNEARAYYVTEQMVEKGLFHRGNVITVPSSGLQGRLSASQRWVKAFDCGNCSIFIRG